MTNNTTATKREALSAAGLLWIESTPAAPIGAPERFGGERWDRQLTNVVEYAKREGDTLRTDSDVFGIGIAGDAVGTRLGELVGFVIQQPTRRLYVPGSVFKDLDPVNRALYISKLDARGTQLIFCDE